MADGGGGGRWGRRIFLGFVALTVVSLVLGYLGLLLRARSSPELRTHWWDLLYWDLQLFVLDSEPAADGHAMPILLHIARFTAPAVTAYALVRTAYALFERRLHEWAAQRSRRHVIVCGFEPATAGLVRELAEAGERVVVIAEQPVDAGALPRRVAAIVGDPRTEEVLRRAGIATARDVMAVTPDSSFNAEVGLVVAAVARRDGLTVRCHAEIADREVCAALVADREGGDHEGDRERLHFFSRHDRAAADLVERSALGASHPERAGGPPPILVVGGGQLAYAVLLELGRLWAVLLRVWREKDLDVGPLPVRLVAPGGDPDAELARLPLPDGALRVTVGTADPATLTTADRFRVPLGTGPDGRGTPDADPAHVFVCLDDDLVALRVGVVAADVLPHARVVAAVTSGTVFGEVLDGGGAGGGLAGRLVLHNVTRTVYASRSVRRDQIEDMARAAHRAYVAAATARGETPATNPSMVPWDELPEHLRRANRAQAEDVPRKLAAIGCEIGPTSEVFAFTDEEVEVLARREHDRWMAERRAEGYTYGPERDDERKRHPKLVPWEELDDEDRDKDRTAVLAIPSFLTGGLGIVRRGERAQHREAAR